MVIFFPEESRPTNSDPVNTDSAVTKDSNGVVNNKLKNKNSSVSISFFYDIASSYRLHIKHSRTYCAVSPGKYWDRALTYRSNRVRSARRAKVPVFYSIEQAISLKSFL